jgi:hypothetical protein
MRVVPTIAVVCGHDGGRYRLLNLSYCEPDYCKLVSREHSRLLDRDGLGIGMGVGMCSR